MSGGLLPSDHGSARPHTHRRRRSTLIPSLVLFDPLQCTLQVNSTRNYVQLAYDSHDRSGLQRHYSDASIVDWHEKNEDGPHFPRYNGRGNSFRVTKRGSFNANYSMEFNAMARRASAAGAVDGQGADVAPSPLLPLRRVDGGTTNCTHRAMTYSGGAPAAYIPLGAGNGEEERCALWTGGETEETLQREEEHRLEEVEEEQPVEPVESAEPITEPSSEESPEQVPSCNCEPEPRAEQPHSDIVVLIRHGEVLVGSMSGGGRPEMVPVESTHVSGTVNGHGLSVGRWWKLKEVTDSLSESAEESIEEPVVPFGEPLDQIEEPVETSQQVEEPVVNTLWE